MEPSLFNAMERGFTTRVSESSSVRSVFRPRKIRSTGSDRKSTRLNSSHSQISYAVFCLKKKKNIERNYINTSRNTTSVNILQRHSLTIGTSRPPIYRNDTLPTYSHTNRH